MPLCVTVVLECRATLSRTSSLPFNFFSRRQTQETQEPLVLSSGYQAVANDSCCQVTGIEVLINAIHKKRFSHEDLHCLRTVSAHAKAGCFQHDLPPHATGHRHGCSSAAVGKEELFTIHDHL